MAVCSSMVQQDREAFGFEVAIGREDFRNAALIADDHAYAVREAVALVEAAMVEVERGIERFDRRRNELGCWALADAIHQIGCSGSRCCASS